MNAFDPREPSPFRSELRLGEHLDRPVLEEWEIDVTTGRQRLVRRFGLWCVWQAPPE